MIFNINFSKNKKIVLISMLISLLWISGCGPSRDQLRSLNDSKSKALNAIQGAKKMIQSAEQSGADKHAKEEIVQAKKLLNEAEQLSAQAEAKDNKEKNKKILKEATELYAKSEVKAHESYKQAETAQQKTHKARAEEAITEAKGNIKKAKDVQADTLAKNEFSNATVTLNEAENLFNKDNFIPSETKAKEATKHAVVAEQKARQEQSRLDDVKNRIAQKANRVKELQDELERAINNKEVKRVARLMIELTLAEIDLAQEKIKEGIDVSESKIAIVKYEKENKELIDLEKRLLKALENEEEALKKLEKIRREKEELKKEMENEETKLKSTTGQIENLEKNRTELEKEKGKW